MASHILIWTTRRPLPQGPHSSAPHEVPIVPECACVQNTSSWCVNNGVHVRVRRKKERKPNPGSPRHQPIPSPSNLLTDTCAPTHTHRHMTVHSLIVGVSVQAINNDAVDCEGTGMTQTAHGVEFCVCAWIHRIQQTHTKPA